MSKITRLQKARIPKAWRKRSLGWHGRRITITFCGYEPPQKLTCAMANHRRGDVSQRVLDGLVDSINAQEHLHAECHDGVITLTGVLTGPVLVGDFLPNVWYGEST